MAPTSLRAEASRKVVNIDALVSTAYAAGAALLAGEAAVHIQQFFALFHGVRWVGPLFLGNAAACLVVIAGLAFRPTRRVAALGGVVLSDLTLGELVASYGQGLFGWQEACFRTPVALAVIAEVGAVLALTAGLTPKERS